jgi:hypothetical protein
MNAVLFKAVYLEDQWSPSDAASAVVTFGVSLYTSASNYLQE